MHFAIDRTIRTTAFDELVLDHWLERKIAQTANASAMQDQFANDQVSQNDDKNSNPSDYAK